MQMSVRCSRCSVASMATHAAAPHLLRHRLPAGVQEEERQHHGHDLRGGQKTWSAELVEPLPLWAAQLQLGMAGGLKKPGATRLQPHPHPPACPPTMAEEALPSMDSGARRRSSMNSSGNRNTVVTRAARCLGLSWPMPAWCGGKVASTSAALHARARQPGPGQHAPTRTLGRQQQLQHLPANHEQENGGSKELQAAEHDDGAPAGLAGGRAPQLRVGCGHPTWHQVKGAHDQLRVGRSRHVCGYDGGTMQKREASGCAMPAGARRAPGR